MRANPNLDPYNLRIGMQLCLPIHDDDMNSMDDWNNMNNRNNMNDRNNMNNMSNNYTEGRVYSTQRGDTSLPGY